MRTLLKALIFLLIVELIHPLDKYEVLKETLQESPRRTGAINLVNGDRLYFSSGNFSLEILSQNFKKIGILRFNRKIAAFSVCDLHNDGTLHVLTLERDNISDYIWDGKKFSRPKVLLEGEFLAPLFLRYVENIDLGGDIDNDGDYDLILPEISGNYGIYKNNGESFELIRTLPFQGNGIFTDRLWKNSEQRSNYIKAEVRIPKFVLLDFNNDGLIDISFRERANVNYYLTRPGKEEAEPNFFIRRRSVYYPVNFNSLYNEASDFADLDGDGDYDLMISVVKGLGLNIHSEVHIFWNDGTVPQVKGHISEDIAGGFFSAFPVSANGKTFLLMPVADVGMNFFFNYIVQRKIIINAAFYQATKTSLEKVQDYNVSFHSEGMLFPGFSIYDFDQDGYSDFALGHKIETLNIYEGNEKMKKSKELEINVPSYGIIRSLPPYKGRGEAVIYLPQTIPGYNVKDVYLLRFTNSEQH